jgi:hypothetical protein
VEYSLAMACVLIVADPGRVAPIERELADPIASVREVLEAIYEQDRDQPQPPNRNPPRRPDHVVEHDSHSTCDYHACQYVSLGLYF